MSNYRHHFLFDKKNFVIMLGGIGLMLLGCILMIGGGSAPDLTTTYPEDTLYGFQRTVLAPILVLAGLITQIFAIFAKPENTSEIEQLMEADEVKQKKSKKSTARKANAVG